MISTDLRHLAVRLKQYGDAGMEKDAFLKAFLDNISAIADEAEQLERAQVGAPSMRKSQQLELIVGGKP